MTLQVYNTLGRQKEKFKPLKENEVKMYSCGPTVYDYPHIGNLRAMLFADTLYRWLKEGEKYDVKWVMNITDVDDKTIRRSKEEFPNLDTKKSLKRFTRQYETIFFEDLEKLNIKRQSFVSNPRATEFIDQMQDLITKIYENGYAKIIEGSVFFDVAKYIEEGNDYGVLLKLDLSNLQTGSRTLADETTKDNLQDFALWKGAKEGEPFWDYELDGVSLPGRPGWHIECSGMGCDLLGLPFDIHTGGVDLIFPHHENEIAQAYAGLKTKTATYWLHNEHFLVDGKKMSKSLGNFYILSDLLEKGYKADTIRFFIVTQQYRAKFNLSDEAFRSAENTLQKIRNALDLFQKSREGSETLEIDKFKNNFYEAMQDDLNAPVAISVLHDLLGEISGKNFTKNSKKAVLDFINFTENVFGVRFLPAKSQIPPSILEMGEARLQAKKDKDFQKADDLRDQIINAGFEIRDKADGFEIVPLEK